MHSNSDSKSISLSSSLWLWNESKKESVLSKVLNMPVPFGNTQRASRKQFVTQKCINRKLNANQDLHKSLFSVNKSF